MDSFWLTVLALAIAGIDPIGALIGIVALAGGARRSTVVTYGCAKFIGAISVGTILSLTVKKVSVQINWSFPMISDATWATGEFVLGAILLAIGLKLWRDRQNPNEMESKWTWMFRSPATLITAGFLTGITAPTDPTFDAVVYLAGQTNHLVTIIAAHTIWITVSQLPLTILMLAVIFNKHRAVATWIQKTWNHIQPLVRYALIALVTIAGIFLVLNVGARIVTGYWFPLR